MGFILSVVLYLGYVIERDVTVALQGFLRLVHIRKELLGFLENAFWLFYGSSGIEILLTVIFSLGLAIPEDIRRTIRYFDGRRDILETRRRRLLIYRLF